MKIKQKKKKRNEKKRRFGILSFCKNYYIFAKKERSREHRASTSRLPVIEILDGTRTPPRG